MFKVEAYDSTFYGQRLRYYWSTVEILTRITRDEISDKPDSSGMIMSSGKQRVRLVMIIESLFRVPDRPQLLPTYY